MGLVVSFIVDADSVARLYLLSTRRNGSFSSIQRYVRNTIEGSEPCDHEFVVAVHKAVQKIRRKQQPK